MKELFVEVGLDSHLGDDGEFRDLRPVAEITDFLMEQVRRMLNHPVFWVPETNDEEQKKLAADKIARDVHMKLIDYCTSRFWKVHLTQWNVAYNYNGKNSSKKRTKLARWREKYGSVVIAFVYVCNHNFGG
jgi:hypothetical protein